MSDRSENKVRRRWGDRRDGRWVRDASGLSTIMVHLMPNRTDSEVYLHDTLDCTELLRYLEKQNEGKTEEKMTMFHCVVTAVARMIRERPKMNRFVQGRRIYQRDEITLSFIAKRRFTDHAEESLMVIKAKDTDNIHSISKTIIGDVREARRTEDTADGINGIINTIARLPRPLLMLFFWILRILDFWGKVPGILMEGDTNYTTVLLSNLGSIKCPAVYHHLNNYGTNSIMITIGTIHKEERLMEDGHKEIRDVVDIGVTIDERIADGFYFARSLKLIHHICAHPELLEQELGQESGFRF